MRSTNFKYLFLAVILLPLSMPLTVLADADFGELAVGEDISPQERLSKKVELTQNALSMALEKAEGMKNSLEMLKLEPASSEEELKNLYLNEVAGYINFYQEKKTVLAAAASLDEVDATIQAVIEYRERIYAPSAKNVLEFILVFSYSPSILEIAKERYTNISADVTRLGGLSLVEEASYGEALEKSRTALQEAEELQAQAKQAVLAAHQPIMATEGVVEASPENEVVLTEVLTPKDLSEASLNKIKEAYAIFIETGQKIKEALGI